MKPTTNLITNDSNSAVSRFIGTSNHGFAQYAQEEIRRLIPGVKFTPIVPAEVFLFETPLPYEQAIRTLREQEPIFLRHMHPASHELESTGSEADLDRLKQQVGGSFAFTSGEKVAVQVRKEERAQAPYSPFAVKVALDETLTDIHGAEPVVRGADRIISVYVTAAKLYAGVSRPADNLSDWSGGAIRFQKEEDQISRAKFKLLEAEQRFGLDLRQFRAGLDLGAAPGGWTSLLLERGMKVSAIDPANLHPSLLAHPRLTYYKKNAADVKLRHDEFDLLVLRHADR